MIVDPLDIPIPAIAEFCRRWGVRELSLFGSALRADFSPESDVDFLMTMPPGSRYSWNDYLCMKGELEALLSRKVDLVDRQVVEESKNWIRRRHILSTCETLYAEG